MATGRINQIAGGGFARREAGGRTGGADSPATRTAALGIGLLFTEPNCSTTTSPGRRPADNRRTPLSEQTSFWTRGSASRLSRGEEKPRFAQQNAVRPLRGPWERLSAPGPRARCPGRRAPVRPPEEEATGPWASCRVRERSAARRRGNPTLRIFFILRPPLSWSRRGPAGPACGTALMP